MLREVTEFTTSALTVYPHYLIKPKQQKTHFEVSCHKFF